MVPIGVLRSKTAATCRRPDGHTSHAKGWEMEYIGEESYAADYAAVALDGSTFYLQPSRLTPRPVAPPHQVPSVADGFRATMRALASGVVLITTAVGGRPWGVTVS